MVAVESAVATDSATFEGDVGLEAPGPLKVSLCGQQFTARTSRPIGAFTVFCARLKSGDGITIGAAPLRLLMSWIVPEEHDALMEAMESVDDMEEWTQGEFAAAVEVLVARPT